MDKLLEEYIIKWQLHVAGAVKVSAFNFILPVTYNNIPAILKISRNDSVQQIAEYYNYIQGQGAANLFLADDKALLLERLEEKPSLPDLPEEGQDNISCNIIVKTIKTLHAANGAKPQSLQNLKQRFKPLLDNGNVLAKELMEKPLNEIVLHGDIHHANIMYSTRGWLAIDAKPVIGENTYEAAIALCSPYTAPHIVLDAKRMNTCADIFAKELRLEKKRLLQFAAIHASLAAILAHQDDDSESMEYWNKCSGIAIQLT